MCGNFENKIQFESMMPERHFLILEDLRVSESQNFEQFTIQYLMIHSTSN